jgi:TolB-like protein
LVADFGIGKALGAASETQLTETGLTVGTPAYMSPEQAAGDKDLTARSDVYSLGIVLYEMLAGETPFAAPTAQAMIARRFMETPKPVRDLRDSVPEGAAQAVHRALARTAADRYATAAEFAQALLPGASTPVATPAVRTSTVPASSLGAEPAAPTVAVEQPLSPKLARRRMPVAAVSLGLGILIGLGVLFAWRRSHLEGDSAGGGLKRLAVLPFENLGDSASEYFADGVTDAVRGKLAGLPELQVIASASASQYKRSAKAPQEIARELGVDYLLVGKIRWAREPGAASRVQVSPELMRVTPGAAPTTTWQQPFDAALTDVFQVQADIAGRVAEALNLALGTAQRQTLAERPTASLPAYEAFLQGEAAAQHLTLFNAASLERAIGFYQQAVALDSGFAQAWAQLARAQATYYGSVIPTPAAAEAARRAAERAVALAPGRPEGQLALGDYQVAVRGDQAKALAAYEAGLRAAPDNAELLASAAGSEQALGRWESSLARLERAQVLDPRSVRALRDLAFTLVLLRRYPEALAVYDRGLALAPSNLALLEGKAMAHLGQGDLAGARAVVRSALGEVEPTTLVAFFALYSDLVWVLDDDQQQLLLRLTPKEFGNDVGSWGLALAQTYHLRGNDAKARAYGDSARLGYEEHLRATPEDPQQHGLLGLSLAYLGRKAQAIREGERGVANAPIATQAGLGPYLQHQLARIYMLTGEPDKALDALEPLLKIPYFLSPGWLKIDPNFAPLRGNPRFERLVNGK